MFSLIFTERASADLDSLEKNKSQKARLKAVKKTLGYLEKNPRHPSLNTHKYSSLAGPNGEEVFEAYAQNNTPCAYRIFWYYGPEKKEITIITITKHP
jgi:hypothetical protein